jgi:8-oxo-dGTP diphosphatase
MAGKVVLVVAAALIDADGRVLLAQRPEGRSMAGLWEFPGGKVEPGETPEAALIRELHEELSIEVRLKCLAPFTFASHAYATFHLLMPLYVCKARKARNSPGSEPAGSVTTICRQRMSLCGQCFEIYCNAVSKAHGDLCLGW